MSAPEFDHLLSFCIEYAKRRLDKQGAFYPFGASMKNDGSASADGIPREAGMNPTMQAVIDIYVEMYRQRAQEGSITAAAICWDGSLTLQDGKKIDAITLVLEHKSKESYFAYLPYEKDEAGYTYGEFSSVAREPQFFV